MGYIPQSMVTTAVTLDGYRIVQTIGLVRGLVCRSRSIVGSFFAGLQTIFGEISRSTLNCVNRHGMMPTTGWSNMPTSWGPMR